MIPVDASAHYSNERAEQQEQVPEEDTVVSELPETELPLSGTLPFGELGQPDHSVGFSGIVVTIVLAVSVGIGGILLTSASGRAIAADMEYYVDESRDEQHCVMTPKDKK